VVPFLSPIGEKMKLKNALYAMLLILAMLLSACGEATVSAPTSVSATNANTNVNANTSVNTPGSTTGEVTISSTNAFVDSFGTYHVVGEVANNSSQALNSIELTVEITDASGNSLLKDDSGNTAANAVIHSMLFTLAPGEASPFEYSYETTGGTPASYKVKITGQQTASVSRAALKSEDVQLTDDGSGWYYLTGELVNTGTQWAHINSLAGAVLDDSNNLLSTDWTSTFSTELAPAGDSQGRDKTPFEINFPNPGNSTQWSLYWDADVIDSVTDYSLDVKVTDFYFDQYGSAHLVGWVTNNSSQSLDSMVVGGLYGADGTVLDSSYAFVPIPLKPGVAAPFNISSFGSVNYNSSQAALVKSTTAQIDSWFTSPLSTESVDLVYANQTIQSDGATWTFGGDVTNTSGKKLSGITVVVMISDAQGKLVGMEYTSISPSGDSIAAGDTNTYSISISLDPAVDTAGFTTTTLVVGAVK
jgi:hypothetical protein